MSGVPVLPHVSADELARARIVGRVIVAVTILCAALALATTL